MEVITDATSNVVVTDVASLDVELLQLPDFSGLALKPNLNFIEKLFDQWLSLPESNRLVCFVPFRNLHIAALRNLRTLLSMLLFPLLIYLYVYVCTKNEVI